MKTLFGTTEKSNFILNMKESTLYNITEKLLFWGAVLIFLTDALALFFDTLGYLTAVSVTIVGFAAVLVYLVYTIKKLSAWKNPILISLIALSVFTVLSHVAARDPEVSLFGNTGRFEGILALLSYLGIFLLASNLKNEMFIKRLVNLFMGISVVHSIIGILQSIPALNFPSKFARLFPDPGIVEYAYLPSGFCGTPFAFALFLSMSLGVALVCAFRSTSKNGFIAYGICAVLFTTLILMTHTLSGVAGVIAAYLIAGIFAFTRLKKDKTSPVRFSVILAVSAAVFIIAAALRGYILYDRLIAYQDSYYNLGTTGIYPVALEQENLFTEFWGKTADIIRMFPMFGTGPDCLFVPQQHGMPIVSVFNSFDRCYNDFLYIAGTRGIPALIAYLALLVTVIINGIKRIKNADEASFTAMASLAAIIAYIAASFFNASALTVTPFFFLLAGIPAIVKSSGNSK